MVPKVEEEFDRLIKTDVIEPVAYSDWAAPNVPGKIWIRGDWIDADGKSSNQVQSLPPPSYTLNSPALKSSPLWT